MKNSEIRLHKFINFTAKVKEFATLLTQGRNKGLYAIDISLYGIAPYCDDCENGTILRNNVAEIAHELFDFNREEAQENARLKDAYADELTLQGR